MSENEIIHRLFDRFNKYEEEEPSNINQAILERKPKAKLFDDISHIVHFIHEALEKIAKEALDATDDQLEFTLYDTEAIASILLIPYLVNSWKITARQHQLFETSHYYQIDHQLKNYDPSNLYNSFVEYCKQLVTDLSA